MARPQEIVGRIPKRGEFGGTPQYDCDAMQRTVIETAGPRTDSNQRGMVTLELYEDAAYCYVNLYGASVVETGSGITDGHRSAHIGVTDTDLVESFGHALIAAAHKARSSGVRETLLANVQRKERKEA